MPTLIAPELLAPAGSLKYMRYAFAHGADAVYAGARRYSLWVRAWPRCLRQVAGGRPNSRLKARLKAASDS